MSRDLNVCNILQPKLGYPIMFQFMVEVTAKFMAQFRVQFMAKITVH